MNAELTTSSSAHASYGRNQKRPRVSVIYSFASLLFLSPYLQHGLYHVTLFSGLGPYSNPVFTFCSACVLLSLIACMAKSADIERLARKQLPVGLAALMSLPALALLYFSPGVLTGPALFAVACAASAVYAVSFSLISMSVFLSLRDLARSVGPEATVGVVSIVSATSLVLFSVHTNQLYYTGVAVVALSLSGLIQLAHIKTASRETFPSPSGADGPSLSLGSWTFYYVTFFAVILLHALLYSVDPSLEFLTDAPESIFVALLLLLLLGVLSFALQKSTLLSSRVICVYGNALFIIVVVGLLLVSIYSFTHGDYARPAGLVLALMRVFAVLFLVMILVNRFNGSAGFIRAAALYLTITQPVSRLFSYAALPAASSVFPIDASARLGELTMAISVFLVLAIIVFLTSLIFKLGTAQSGDAREARAATQKAACAATAEQFDLSQREEDVLFYISLGYTNKAIGDKLVISPETVRSHAKRIYAKLGVHSKQELIELVESRMGDIRS